MFVYLFVCVCVCERARVCMREKESEKDRYGESMSESIFIYQDERMRETSTW